MTETEQTEQTQQTDKELYDMAEHLKECYEKMEKKMNKFKEENLELKKLIMMNYSLFRLVSNEIDNDNHILDEFSISHLIEIGRSLNSNIIHDLIIN